jgi:phage shock protein PspC (stress-responsive transcriptional regulator)
MRKRLIKSSDKKLLRVAGGVADYFDVDPTLVRVGFIASAVCFFPFSVVAYVALAVMMPSPSTAQQTSGAQLDLRDCE